MSLDLSQFEARKKSHLEIALDPRMQVDVRAEFDRIVLPHDALPELDFAEIDLATPFLFGPRVKKLATPFFVSGMTAGHAAATVVNERLASACARRGWIFGVGSQRRELDRSRPVIDSWSDLRAKAPNLTLLGNLGLAQAITETPAEIARLARNLGADAFCIHANALQETIQPEGTPNFRGGLAALKNLIANSDFPIVLKETGCGFSERTLEKIRAMKFAAVDVAGLGGTHWGRIEGVRALIAGKTVRSRAAETFRSWGISTVASVEAAARILPRTTEIWASGGVRSGLDAAKLIYLGATRVGFAKPALEAALQSEAALDLWMETMEYELKTALFCGGFTTPENLRKHAAARPKKAPKKSTPRKAKKR
jgi:isopentenyl-diphosphate delta-isomerase